MVWGSRWFRVPVSDEGWFLSRIPLGSSSDSGSPFRHRLLEFRV